MKKTFLLLAAMVALNVWADVPTASVASVQIYYCQTELKDTAVICKDGSYEWDGTVYTESGTYTKTYINRLGCDSTVRLNLTFKVFAFSVAQGQQVIFSPGNLQYQGSTSSWCFAEHQWTVIGNKLGNTKAGTDVNNTNDVRAMQSDTIDLFGFGTSGKNYYPYQAYSNSGEWQAKYANATIAGTNNDWGVYNNVALGGSATKPWRTLTQGEWDFLLNTRTNAANYKGFATVNGVKGLILLPDGWTGSSIQKYVSGGAQYTDNVYNDDAWLTMENNGAVFLPVAGNRNYTTVNISNDAFYWTSTLNSGTNAYALKFWPSSTLAVESAAVYYGYAVRLVKDK